MRGLIIFFTLGALVITAQKANAQFGGNQFNFGGVISLTDELTIDVIPTYPKPNSAVEMNLRMYTEDLNTASIAWFLNGKKLSEGKGLTNLKFKTGASGSRSNIVVSITLASGMSFSKEVDIHPAQVDLLWQGHSYVPPFYKGKAMFPNQGSATVLAMPEIFSGGSRIPANRLVYKWTVNDVVAQNQSGYGKNVLYVAGSMLGIPLNIDVEVTDPSTNSIAVNSIVLSPTDPQIVFYENHPLYGIVFENAVNNGVKMSKEELSVVAAPYYITEKDNIAYKWKMNGQSTEAVSGLSATFRKPENISGSTFLSLVAENQIKVLQFAEGGFRINYETNE